MDKIRRKTDKGEIQLSDFQTYVDEFLHDLSKGESIKNALARILLSELAFQWTDRYDDYVCVKSDINIDAKNELATYEAELIQVDDYDKYYCNG